MVRVRRPTSRISPPGPCRMVTVAASQASRRAVSAETWMPPASSSTVWLPAAGGAGGAVGVAAGAAAGGAHGAGSDPRPRASEAGSSDAAVADAAGDGRDPGHGPPARCRRPCRLELAPPAVSAEAPHPRGAVLVPPADPSATAPRPSPTPSAADVPAGTWSSSTGGLGSDAASADAPARTWSPAIGGLGRATPAGVPARGFDPRPDRRASRRSRGNVAAARRRFRSVRRDPGRSRGNAIVSRPRSVRCAPGRSRGDVRPRRQRVRVHVQHHLIAVAGRPAVEPARQRRLRHRPDGVRLPLRERRLLHIDRGAGRRGGGFPVPGLAGRSGGGTVGGVPLPGRARVGHRLLPVLPAAVRGRLPPRLVARRLQRPPQRRPDLRRQPPADDHHPVLVHPCPQFPARVPQPVLGLLRVLVDAPPRARDALHVRRCARFAYVEQVVLVVGGGHARDRAHLRVGDPAAAHGVAQLGQLAEGAGHPHVLAGGPRREPGAPAQPLRARQAAVPALPLVELADEDEQLVGGGLDAGGQLGNAVAEPGEPASAVAGRRRRRRGRRFGGRSAVADAVAGRLRRAGGRRFVGRSTAVDTVGATRAKRLGRRGGRCLVEGSDGGRIRTGFGRHVEVVSEHEPL